MKKVNVITLGCAKNTVDSERLALQLRCNGYQVLHNSSDAAQIVIVNTCGFIDAAKREAIDVILQCAKARQQNKIEQLFVMGCLSQRYAEELRKEIPEVDAYFGVHSIQQVLKALNAVCYSAQLNRRLVSTPQHYAYLKIADGCNRQCSYCSIPSIRGKYASAPLPSLVEESQQLAQQGVKELILVAQDLSYYGMDICRKPMLADLLRSLSQIEGIEWLRLHYAYPAPFPASIIDEMQHNPKVCHYLDIPLQHSSNKVLSAMRRGYSQNDIEGLVDTLRMRIPDIALRTTLMVGHPGEDPEAFGELLQFAAQQRFERLGVFAYSAEDGTYSAAHFPDSIPQGEKQHRLQKIMHLQREISAQLNAQKIGCTLRVVIDKKEGNFWIARSQYHSPEVDGEIFIDAAAHPQLNIGNFYGVKITDASEYDLFAVLND